MVYNFEIISGEAKDFIIKLQINEGSTFYSLHVAIQESIGYQSHQLASFFIPNKRGVKTIEVSMLDPGINGFPYYSMYKTKLSEFNFSEGSQIGYTFDFINDRSFILELTGIYMEKNLNEPLVTLVKGEAPVQILEEDVATEEAEAKQEDEVFQDFGVLEDYTEIFGEMDPV